MDAEEGSRTRQILIGALICGAIACMSAGLMLGWRRVPGVLGEWLGMLAGIISTPFLLEASFVSLGLIIVISLNVWRRHRDGDEYVYLQEEAEVAAPLQPLPEETQPEKRSIPSASLEELDPLLLMKAKDALAIGEHQVAAEIIAEMSEEQLSQPELVAIRLRIARMSGNSRAEERLARELRNFQANPSPQST